MIDTNSIIKKARKSFLSREDNRPWIEECYEYLQPARNGFKTKDLESKKQNTNSKIFDSTPINSAINFINTMSRSFTPLYNKWGKLEAGVSVPEDSRQELNEALEKNNDTIFQYLNVSNFATSLHQFYFDWGIGTGALFLYESNDVTNPFNFVAVPISELGLSEGINNKVDGIFREIKLEARLIKPKWGNQDNFKLTENLQNLIQHKPDENIDFIEALNYDYDNRVWRHKIIYEADKHELFEQVFEDQICFTPRWNKLSGNPYGRGVFAQALPDIKTLNQMMKDYLDSAQLRLKPPIAVKKQGVHNLSSVRLAPLNIIPIIGDEDINRVIRPLDYVGSFQESQFLIETMRHNIKKIMLDNQLPAQQATPASAYEIAQRIKEIEISIGSAYAYGIEEFINPLYKRMATILYK